MSMALKLKEGWTKEGLEEEEKKRSRTRELYFGNVNKLYRFGDRTCL